MVEKRVFGAVLPRRGTTLSAYHAPAMLPICIQNTYLPLHSVGRLYRGLVPPLLLEAPKRAVKFAANDFWGKTFLDLAGEKKMTQNLSVLTGAAAGATESFVVVPFELVKIRLQDKNSVYKGPMDVVRQTVAKEGLLGLYAGMESTFWRCAIHSFSFTL